MTLEEMDSVIQKYCDGRLCGNCIIRDLCVECGGVFPDDADCAEEAFKIIQSLNFNNKDSSNVDHPSHYNANGAMECIDEMVLIFGKEATMHFCLLNAWKYRYRANAKNGQEDLDKANWYIAKYKELRDLDGGCIV